MIASVSNDPTGAQVEVATSADEREVRAVLDRWVRAIRSHDLDAVCAERTDDIVMFDVPEPIRLAGMGEYRSSWVQYFSFEGSREFQLQDLHVVCGSDLAWAHALLRCEGVPEATARLTVGFVKQDGAWRVAHEHHSGPAK
ncbi:YybH family protein [Rhizobium leguminosarum]|uniref:YybH family protein n=1 Tax=Rhizobium leguminosarum TaxID=384 RepID=UPI0014429C90|nr:nuclear transport factor 2 family protein [Rhizobium leguminosarum]NKK66468.1 DUF4440 domain-containing protein [Rhizobium leguminosarum bv. viciae]NKL09193.1 DUF4440 domain-containing protein [Rhizobium leguminosarum bv. viciae]NKL87160.1 DUF4440 domain-containing protein [Rhizobium leguminosarum bv. viciae]NKL94235.1 DUF4440 domain-containing protein [Rhizobium leguminosarum bv. viciae]NKM94142.1 DUF4440 domain-containing protein [Rhizobium leguminosarum bv. viciae]